MTQDLPSLVFELLSEAEGVMDVTSPELIENKIHEIADARDNLWEAMNVLTKREDELGQQKADLRLMRSKLLTMQERLGDKKWALIRQRKDSRADG